MALLASGFTLAATLTFVVPLAIFIALLIAGVWITKARMRRREPARLSGRRSRG